MQSDRSNLYLTNMPISKKHVACLVFMILFSMMSVYLEAREIQAPKESSQAYNPFLDRKETKFPGTHAGKKTEGFWRAFEKADVAWLEAFFRENVPQDKLQQVPARDRAQRMAGLRQQLGKELRLSKIISLSPEEISLVIVNQNNEMFKLNLLFEKKDNRLWLKALAVDEAGPEDLAPPLPAMNLEQALKGIEQDIEKAVQEDRFSGVVLMAREFAPVFFKAYGLASREFSVPNRTNTRFNLGSINKIFTKIAIAQLARQGKLSLDDKLGKFLPDYPNPEAREKVTVRHLVNMTSGIGDFFGPEFEQTPKDLIRHNRNYLKFFAAKPLAFEPGTRELYSNGGYVVLGEIISVASGMDYYDYVRQNIFEPAGMKDSDWFEADAVIPNLAEGYTRQTEETEKTERHPASPTWRKNIYTRPARGSAAGGGYATAEDLLRFVRALYECRLLNEAWTNWVFTGQEPGHSNPPKIDRSRWSLGIAGGAPGINAALEFEAQADFTIIVLGNYDPPAASQVARMIRRYLGAVKK